jgi:transmembrane sensor
MHSEQARLQYLFQKYFDKTATAEERTELAAMIDNEDHHAVVMQVFKAAWENFEGEAQVLTNEKTEEILHHILGNGFHEEKLPAIRAIPLIWKRVAVAASVMLLLGIGAWMVYSSQSSRTAMAKTNQPVNQDVLPGKDGAILTLGNGEKIKLDDLADGTIAGTAKKSGSLLSYAQAKSGSATEYNTLSTPNGRQFSLVLADNSRVWLNAASSITYPSIFGNEDRTVQITGEAYFEIAYNSKKPFRVMVNGLAVQVMGTHFNVNSYGDEDETKTTLLEGSIKISKAGVSKLVKPGQQALVNKGGEINLINKVDVDAVVAWKNGYFSFEKADLQTIMRQVARWYDVQVSFEGRVPTVQFSGEIGRGLTLTQFLSILDETRIRYRIEGKSLVIFP